MQLLAFISTTSSPTRSLSFAVVYFLMGIVAIMALVMNRQEDAFKSEPTGRLTIFLMVVLFITWGLCSLGDARGWRFFQKNSLMLHLVPAGAVALACARDYIRTRWRSADQRRRGLLRIAAILFVIVCFLIGVWCFNYFS